MAQPGQPLPAKETALFRQVVKLYETKQYKKAIKAADQILKKFPDHGETLAMKVSRTPAASYACLLVFNLVFVEVSDRHQVRLCELRPTGTKELDHPSPPCVLLVLSCRA